MKYFEAYSSISRVNQLNFHAFIFQIHLKFKQRLSQKEFEYSQTLQTLEILEKMTLIFNTSPRNISIYLWEQHKSQFQLLLSVKDFEICGC